MKIRPHHISGTLLITAALAPFAAMGILTLGWEKTLGCLLVGAALGLVSIVLVLGVSVLRGE